MGVSFVIPVRNGAPWLDRVLDAIRAQSWHGPVEIIAIDDGSTDASAEILARHARASGLIVLTGAGLGAAAALNQGIRAASHPLIAQVDQDVEISRDWLARLVAALDDGAVAAAQGRYVPESHAGLWSRVTALDLALRYHRLGRSTDHVCTGNTVYRRDALAAVGLFDQRLGYGYDNDLSYRLRAAGYALRFDREAVSVHHWRDGFSGYVRQQYGFGYGRLNVLAKHPGRAGGDDVSGRLMMLQAPLTALALIAAPVAPALAASLVAFVLAERGLAGLRAARTFHDAAGLLFAPVHLVRNLAWVAAIGAWTVRAARGIPARPTHSMRARRAPDVI